MLSVLEGEMRDIAQWLVPLFGDLPHGTIRLLSNDGMATDGISEPGLIWIHPWILKADADFQSLTLAHEVAHQWWGLHYRGQQLCHEAMAEAVGLAWLRRRHGLVTVRRFLSIARGRMFAAHFAPRAAPSDAIALGRDALVIYDCWRSLPDAFLTLARSLLREVPCRNRAARWLHVWQRSEDTLPQPRLIEGVVTDIAATGLPFSIRCRAGSQVHRLRDGERFMAEGINLSDAQDSPVFAGNVSADIGAYFSVAGDQCR